MTGREEKRARFLDEVEDDDDLGPRDAPELSRETSGDVPELSVQMTFLAGLSCVCVCVCVLDW